MSRHVHEWRPAPQLGMGGRACSCGALGRLRLSSGRVEVVTEAEEVNRWFHRDETVVNGRVLRHRVGYDE